METAFQKSINRVARASLGVLPSTPVAFLQAEGGSLPAATRLDRRQSALATRLASAQRGPHSDIVRGQTTIGKRLRGAIGPITDIERVERSALSQGGLSPEWCAFPHWCGKKRNKKRRRESRRRSKRHGRSTEISIRYVQMDPGLTLREWAEQLPGTKRYPETSPHPPLIYSREEVFWASAREGKGQHTPNETGRGPSRRPDQDGEALVSAWAEGRRPTMWSSRRWLTASPSYHRGERGGKASPCSQTPRRP